MPENTNASLILDRFRQNGARTYLTDTQFHDAASVIECLLLDWDGVFNSGQKGGKSVSVFSEPDSMGLNLLRFGFYLRTGRMLPIAIITGQDNPVATEFARREHLDGLYIRVRDKSLPTLHFSEWLMLAPELLACLYDDLNDLPMVTRTGMRMLVNRPASPMFEDFVVQKGLVHYRTGAQSGNYPIREVCELLLALWGVFEQACTERMQTSENYKTYWALRQKTTLRRFEFRDERILELDSGESETDTIY